MKWLSAGLAFVNLATVSAVLLGMAAGGLIRTIALVSVLLGALGAVFAFIYTRDPRRVNAVADGPATTFPHDLSRVWFWLLAGAFAFFAFRTFCWVLFLDGNQFKVQSPNNLGDLALHLTYINNLASGVSLWPENPIYFSSLMRYPAGTDLFNSLLLLLGVDLIPGLVWVGLVGSLATFYALYRWGGSFGVAGFLFNGGLAGFQVFQTWAFLDFQGDKSIAWKSLPLSMLTTQRGLLYALPVGLLLLYQWRAKYFCERSATSPVAETTPRKSETSATPPLPFWLEIALYATMPLFHLHTFMALSVVVATLFVIGVGRHLFGDGDGTMWKQLGTLGAVSFIPATFLVWTVTDHFKASSLLKWHPGWVQGVDDFPDSFFRFWLENFGVWIPLGFLLIGFYVWRVCLSDQPYRFRDHPALAFLPPAGLIFVFACFVKTAPWGWDNIKLIIWAYLIVLPFLWQLIRQWQPPVQAGVCFALFASGFVSLFGGLLTEPAGHNFADRAELDGVGAAVRRLPTEARFAAYPTYNHPLLLQGRKVVLGYPGHLWTQGFDYGGAEKKLGSVMRGAADWKQNARDLRARYLFWGREEKTNYAESTRPWEREAKLIANGSWGAIYDLESPADSIPPRQ